MTQQLAFTKLSGETIAHTLNSGGIKKYKRITKSTARRLFLLTLNDKYKTFVYQATDYGDGYWVDIKRR